MPTELRQRSLTQLMEERPKNLSVVIATPFYMDIGNANYFASLLQTCKVLDKLGIENAFMALPGDSYIDRARNSAVGKFLHEEMYLKYTHIFYIDSDMSWEIGGFLRVLLSGKEICGATYPQKNDWTRWTCLIKHNEDGTPVATDDMLIEADLISGGFMCVRRDVLEQMEKRYIDKGYTDTSAHYREKCAQLFNCEIVNGIRRGEDGSFCAKWQEMGGLMYVDPDVTIGHHGQKCWKGNFCDYLMALPGGSNHG